MKHIDLGHEVWATFDGEVWQVFNNTPAQGDCIGECASFAECAQIAREFFAELEEE